MRDKAELQIHFSRVHEASNAPVMAQPCNFMTARSWVESLLVLGIFYSSQNVRQAELALGGTGSTRHSLGIQKDKDKAPTDCLEPDFLFYLRSLQEKIFRLDVGVDDVCLPQNLQDLEHLDGEEHGDGFDVGGFERGNLAFKMERDSH